MATAKRVLVVDDDDATVAVFRKILQTDQWEVDAYTSGHEAVSQIQPGRYALVVSDLYMPEMSGVDVYHAAVKADPALERRFLFVSGYADSSATKDFLLQTRCAGIRKPIRMEEFRAMVAHVGESKPLQAMALPARWFHPNSLYLYSGEVTGRHTLFSLLNRIYSARITGMLTLQTGRVEKKLYFNLGNLIFAASNLPGDGLGEMMLREGALTQYQFDVATERMKQGQRFGDALVDLGVCAPAQVNDWIRQQVTQIATSIFDYPGGRYYFFDTFGEDHVPEVGIAMPMGRFLLAALREAHDLPLVELATDDSLFVDASPDPLMRFQNVELDDAERRLLAAVEYPMPAGEAMKSAGVSGTQGTRALYALLALGMLMAVPAPAAEAHAEAAPAPAPAASRPAAAPTPPPAAPPRMAAPAPAPKPVAPAQDAAALSEFEAEMRRLLGLLENGTHYQLIGVTANAAAGDIKKSYYQLAKKFHPDCHMGRSEWIGSLQKLMDAFTTAYKTLSDARAREKYDKQIAEGGAFALGRGKTEKQETAEECLERAKECLRGKNFAGSITWLRKCVEIAPNDSKYRAMLARSLGAVPTYRPEAIQHYEKAVELDPWNTSALFQFAELFEEMKLPWRALPLYQKILDIDPDHAKARDRFSKLNAAAGKKDEGNATMLGRLFGKK